MLRRGVMLSLLALAPLSLPGAGFAQRVTPPRNNFDTAVNGMASLCPALVRGEQVPDAAASAAFGLRPIPSPAGEHRFQSLFTDGTLQLWFEPAQHRCTVHYAGFGFPAVAGVGRDLATENGFIRVTGGVREGAQGDAFDRTMTDPVRRERYIILENPTSQTAAISYSRRTNP
jgi:hypothetical protein